MRKNLVLLSLIFLICGVVAQNTPHPMSVHFPPAAIAAFQKIDAQRIRAHVRFLSHDLLEGRGTGQRGGDIAGAAAPDSEAATSRRNTLLPNSHSTA